MKIRQGFVSNSSSSSFILEIMTDTEACPTCGRKDANFVDLVERGGNWCSDDTHMSKYDKEEVLQEIEEEICEIQNRLMDARRDDPHRITYRSHWGGEEHVTRVKDNIERDEAELKTWEDLRARVEPAKGQVIKCYISYHDTLNKIVQSMVDAGTMKILDSENL